MPARWLLSLSLQIFIPNIVYVTEMHVDRTQIIHSYIVNFTY